MSRSKMLVSVVAVAVGVVFLLLAAAEYTVLRTLFALPLVLVLPGYLCTAAAFPRGGLGVVERLLLSLGMSLVLAVLGGLLLHLTPWGLGVLNWVVYFVTVILLAGGVTWWRRRSMPAAVTARRFITISLRQGLLLCTLVLILASAVAVARIGAEEQRVAHFTQFWLLPGGQDEVDQIHLGITNEELQPVRYRVEVSVTGIVVQEWSLIALDQGQRWQTTVTLPMPRDDSESVTALLYRLDAPDVVYRHVNFWRSSGGE